MRERLTSAALYYRHSKHLQAFQLYLLYTIVFVKMFIIFSLNTHERSQLQIPPLKFMYLCCFRGNYFHMGQLN
jgi:hypothetical protein